MHLLSACLVGTSVGAVAAQQVVLPTAAQLRYHEAEIVALVHFNMATFFRNGDPGCDANNWLPINGSGSGNPSSFNPAKLNINQWFDAITALGAKIAVLTTKHGCGYTLWPTSAKLPDGSAFGYHAKADIVKQFVDEAKARGLGRGFYYSIMKSFFLCHSFSGTDSCAKGKLPGQIHVTEDQYEAISLSQVEELWTKYGELDEIWFDSVNFNDPKKQKALEDMEKKYQPNASGGHFSPHAWIGTESGHPAKGELWALGCDSELGNPNASKWCPKTCDTTLQVSDKWFWEPNTAVRDLQEMISVYHDTVGRGCTLELDFAPNRHGLIDDKAVKVYKDFGDWVRTCYGKAVASTSGQGTTFSLAQPTEDVDRVVLQEEIKSGQRVRGWAVQVQDAGGNWKTVVEGKAIGHKRIAMLPSSTKAPIRLTITAQQATPHIRQFGIYKTCPNDVQQEMKFDDDKLMIV